MVPDTSQDTNLFGKINRRQKCYRWSFGHLLIARWSFKISCHLAAEICRISCLMLGAWCLPAGWASLRNWIWVPRWTKRNPRNPRSISSKSHLQEGRWIIYEYDIWYTHIYLYMYYIYIWYMIWIWYDSTVMALRPLDSPRRHPSIRRVQRRPKWPSIFSGRHDQDRTMRWPWHAMRHGLPAVFSVCPPRFTA